MRFSVRRCRVCAGEKKRTLRKSAFWPLRFINSGGDTIFKVALGGHRMTVTHTDGFPVQPRETESIYLSMGKRVDV